MTKSPLIYYCHPGAGGRSLRRTLVLARELGEAFDVSLLTSEMFPPATSTHDGVQIIQLPKLGVNLDGKALDLKHSRKLKQQIVARRDFIIEKYLQLKPRVIVIEGFPFLGQMLAGEVLPLIERAKYGVQGESLVVCAADGIMVDDHKNPDRYYDRSASLLNKYFDLIVVHSDSVFARLEEFFQPAKALTVPIFHTGFLSATPDPVNTGSDKRDDFIIVSAADGLDGKPLFRAAIEAQRMLWNTLKIPMTIVAGDRLPETAWRQLNTLANDVPGLSMVRSVRNIREEIRSARWTVNQCGYNTAVDVVETGVPSLFVPSRAGRSKEQLIRAQKLVNWGAGRLLMPHHLNGASLANDIQQLTKFESRSLSFDCNGAAQTTELISEIVFGDNYLEMAADDLLDRPFH